MFWVEFRCSEYHLGHCTFTYSATAFTLPVIFRVEHWGCLSAVLQGRAHNTLKTAQEGTKEETSSNRAIQAEAQKPACGSDRESSRGHPSGPGSAAACR